MEERYARLARLPEGLEFPDRYQHCIFYDADRNRLVFRGHMSRAAREQLIRLHSDARYRQAIYRLYMGNPRRLWWAGILMAVVAISSLAVAALCWLKE
jgi:hypothetical protein